MDQELKQRLIGAAVVTALAAIFIPMLFDDPVDQSGQVVSELVVPEAPVKASEDAASKLPANAEAVLAQPDQGLTQEEAEATATVSEAEFMDSGAALGADEAIDESVEEPVAAEPVVTLPKLTPKQKPAAKPAPAEVVAQAAKPATVERAAKPPQPKAAAVAKPVAKALEPAKSAASTAKAAPAAKPAAGLSRWYIQVGSYGQEANAMAMWNTLRKQGFPVLMETIHNSEKGTLYRLKVGPELDQKRAAAMKEKLDKQNNLKTMLRAE